MSTILEKCNLINAEKDAKILPENIKAGVQIFDVVGALESGVNTEDANATAQDLAMGSSAYVKGIKIDGNLPVYNMHERIDTGSATYDDMFGIISLCTPMDAILRYDAGLSISQNNIAMLTGITPEKIVAGNTVLGVEGIGGANEGNMATIIYSLSDFPTNAQTGDICLYVNQDVTEFYGIYRCIDAGSWQKLELVNTVAGDEYDTAINTTADILGWRQPEYQDISAFAQTLANLPKEEYDAYYMPYVHISTPVLSSDTTALSALVERMTNDIPALENDESIIFSFYDGEYRISFNSASWYRNFTITDPNDMLLLEFYSIPSSNEVSVGEWWRYKYDSDTSESTYTNVTSIADTISFGTVYNKLASIQMTIPDRLRTQEYIYKILSLLETAFNCTIKYEPEE